MEWQADVSIFDQKLYPEVNQHQFFSQEDVSQISRIKKYLQSRHLPL
jgi:hypothetical protein